MVPYLLFALQTSLCGVLPASGRPKRGGALVCFLLILRPSLPVLGSASIRSASLVLPSEGKNAQMQGLGILLCNAEVRASDEGGAAGAVLIDGMVCWFMEAAYAHVRGGGWRLGFASPSRLERRKRR